LATKDLVYDRNTQKIYASVPGSAGNVGNSIVPINPAAGTLDSAVFIGSEPGKLALSDDGQYLYTALDGAAAVRRFNVATRTAGQQFALGESPTMDHCMPKTSPSCRATRSQSPYH
jgi:DNA-binding beta-propeller fold protein YncE